MTTEPHETSPFHAGEQAVQARMGVRERTEPWARKAIRSTIPPEHRDFYASLPFMVAAARDDRGRPWASLIAGPAGFVHSPDPGSLVLARGPVPGDALDGALRPGVDLGLLGIDLATRRRNRVNGRITAASAEGLVLEVGQSFGNCPKHITERAWRIVEPPLATPRRRVDQRLRPSWIEWIRRADTSFIATGHRGAGDEPSFGMDASHRGGAPGFVDVLDERTLVIPDYAGNNLFNTVGNLELDPRAGLVWVDFATGGMLQLTGTTTIDWDSPRIATTPGARRLIVFELDEGIELERALPLRWDDLDPDDHARRRRRPSNPSSPSIQPAAAGAPPVL